MSGKTITLWAIALVTVIALSTAADAVGVPDASLLAALIVGLVIALRRPDHLAVGPRLADGAQGVVGVTLGAYLQPDTVTAIGHHVLPIVLVSFATLGLTLGVGLVLARLTGLDVATASFGMIAGGASGIISMSDELGADKRLVALLQYARVLIIVIATPLVTKVAFGGGSAHVAASAVPPPWRWTEASAVALGCIAVGIVLGRRLRLPSAPLLGPMFVAAALSVAGVHVSVAPPALVESIALGVIGFDVGVRFTLDSLRRAGNIMIAATLHIVVLLVGCALFGLLLARDLHVSALDGYLATTPGALYVVVASALSSHADGTLVLSVQVLRLFLMLLAAPILARRLHALSFLSTARGPRRGRTPTTAKGQARDPARGTTSSPAPDATAGGRR